MRGVFADFQKSLANAVVTALTITGVLTLGANSRIAGHLIPSANNTYDVGSVTSTWRSGYFGTSLAVPAISVTSTGSGLTLYNTTDQVTDYERGNLAFSSNELLLTTAAGGSGTSRNVRIAAGWATDGLTFQPGGLGICYFCFNRTASAANASVMRITGTQTQSSLTTEGLTIDNTVNQSGSAGYTGLFINPTLTSEGSAGTRLIDLAVGGTSQFYIDKNGYTYVGGSYVNLTEGDGYYFGDNVRGMRYVSGDDFEFQNWHVGGQFYISSFNGVTRTRHAVFDALTKRAAFSSSVDLRNYTPNTDLEVIGTASTTVLLAGPGSASAPSVSFGGDQDTGLFNGTANELSVSIGGSLNYKFDTTGFRSNSNNLRDLGGASTQWKDAYFGGTVSTSQLKINGGTNILGHLSATASLDFASVAAQSCSTLTMTVTGAATTDNVVLGGTGLNTLQGTTGIATVQGYVSAADTVTVKACNVTGSGSSDPASVTIRADVWKH